jgi:hypothetical protein
MMADEGGGDGGASEDGGSVSAEEVEVVEAAPEDEEGEGEEGADAAGELVDHDDYTDEEVHIFMGTDLYLASFWFWFSSQRSESSPKA